MLSDLVLSQREARFISTLDDLLYSNNAFRSFKHGTDSWSDTVRIDSAAAMLAMADYFQFIGDSDSDRVVNYLDDRGFLTNDDIFDATLDRYGIFTGECVLCFGKTYVIADALDDFVRVSRSEGRLHREALKHFTYLAMADTAEFLINPLSSNNAADMEWVFQGSIAPGGTLMAVPYGVGNASILEPSPVELGRYETPMTAVWRIVSDDTLIANRKANDEVQAVEVLIDTLRSSAPGRVEDAKEFTAEYESRFPQAPLSPPIGHSLAAERRSAGVVITLLQAGANLLNIRARSFHSLLAERPTFVVWYRGESEWHLDGAAVFRPEMSNVAPCGHMTTLSQVEAESYPPFPNACFIHQD